MNYTLKSANGRQYSNGNTTKFYAYESANANDGQSFLGNAVFEVSNLPSLDVQAYMDGSETVESLPGINAPAFTESIQFTGAHASKFSWVRSGSVIKIGSSLSSEEYNGGSASVKVGTMIYKVTSGGVTKQTELDLYVMSEGQANVTKVLISNSGCSIGSVQYEVNEGSWLTLGSSHKARFRYDTYDYKVNFGINTSIWTSAYAKIRILGQLPSGSWTVVTQASWSITAAATKYLNNFDPGNHSAYRLEVSITGTTPAGGGNPPLM